MYIYTERERILVWRYPSCGQTHLYSADEADWPLSGWAFGVSGTSQNIMGRPDITGTGWRLQAEETPAVDSALW